MALRLSSLAAQGLATRYGLASLFAGGYIGIYSGAQPAKADEPPQGRLLAVVTVQGRAIPSVSDRAGGLTWQASATYGQVQDTGDWKAVASESGEPGWWRMVALGHSLQGDGARSARIDGAVADSLDLGGLPSLAAGQVVQVAFSARFLPN